jgi:hypothetical protein
MEGAYPSSGLVYSSALELESIPSTDVGILGSEWVSFHPQTSVREQNSDLTFVYNPSTLHYVQPNSVYVYMRCQIQKKDGSKLTATDMAAPCFNFAAGLFSSCDVYLNNTLVSRSNNLYPYSVHLQNLVSTTAAYKSSVLANTQMFMEDTSSSSNDAENDGFKYRFALANLSKTFEIALRPQQNVFECNRFLPPNVGFRLIFRRSLPQFCLVGEEISSNKDGSCPFRVYIDQAVLFIKRHVILPDIQQRHMAILNSGQRLNFPLNNNIMKAFTIPPNTTSVLSQTLFDSNIPNTLIMTFVKTSSVSGTLEQSPFLLQPLGVTYVQIKTDGDINTSQEVTIDENSNTLLQGITSICMSNMTPPSGSGITFRNQNPQYKYKLNFCLVFDLAASSNSNTYSLPRRGSVKTEIRLTENSDSITCIVLGKFDALLQIGKDYEVFSDINLS